MKNIFIMGKAGSGKDLTAAMLSRLYPVQSVALADSIRDEYERFFPEQIARTDRAKLIEIGETYKKLYGRHVWVNCVLEKIEWLTQCEVAAVVTDGRHQIEYDVFVNSLSYVPVFIDCPDYLRYDRLIKRDGTLQEGALAQECQELWTAKAFHIDNSGTPEQLEANVKKLMYVIEGGL